MTSKSDKSNGLDKCYTNIYYFNICRTHEIAINMYDGALNQNKFYL